LALCRETDNVAFKINGEEIQWKNLNSYLTTDSTNQLYFVEEGNEVFAYDGQGELINPGQNNA